MPCNAFQITPDDVSSVLRDYSLRVANANGMSFEHMAEELIDQLDHERIERAALAADCDLTKQTAAAYEEIRTSLVELGVLEF